MDFTAASLNVNKNHSECDVYADVREALAHASVVGLQEAHHRGPSRAVRTVRRTQRWAAYRPHGAARENTIIYDTHVWRRLHGSGRAYTHHGRSHVTPRRSVTWLPLEHRDTGRTVLFADTHCINGYSHARNSAEHFRDVCAHMHWAAVRAAMAKAVTSDLYDATVLVGDFNCRLQNGQESWYPGPMLDGLFDFDDSGSIDRIIVSRGDAAYRRRWSRAVRSDHRLQLATLSL